MTLAVLDLIPPLPSLWAILLLAAGGILWTRGKTALALVPGAIALVMLFGWLMSVLGWIFSTAITLAVVAAVAFGAYWLLVGRKKGKGTVDSTATESRGAIAATDTSLPDIETMLGDMQRDRERVTVRRQ